MKTYKALICDFDNTLVGLDKVLHPHIIDAFKKLISSGVRVSIATGRPYHGVIERIAKAHPDVFTSPLVVHGGAEIVDPQKGKILWGEYISRELFEKMFSYMEGKNVIYLAEYGGNLFAPDGPKTIDYGGEKISIRHISELQSNKVAKVLVSSRVHNYPIELINEVEENLNALFADDLHVIKMGYVGSIGLDITGKTSKHIGVLELMQHMNVKPDEVIGVGDGHNDYPLLTACGTKVAMGDAPEELKEIADFIAPPQSENGILTVIKKYFPFL